MSQRGSSGGEGKGPEWSTGCLAQHEAGADAHRVRPGSL